MTALIHIQRLLTIVLIVFASGSCSTPPKQAEQGVEAAKPVVSKPADRAATPAPALLKNKYHVLKQKYFEVHYDQSYRLARYVKYELTKERLKAAKVKRRNPFKVDPLLKADNLPAVDPSEYKHSGYHKGHLAPAADFAFSQEAMDQTFVMSNMVPQKPRLNSGAWAQLEKQVRRWACGEERGTVITGPIFEGKMPSLRSGLVIPQHFFKVVIDETPKRKALAFIYHQDDSGKIMNERQVPMKELDSRLQENFSALLESDERQPAQAEAWKECEP